MPAVTYSSLLTLLHLTVDTLPQATAEAILDNAIDTINLYANQDIANMSAGTVTLTSPQRGAVLQVAGAIYYFFYKGQTASAIQGMAITASSIMDNPYIVRLLEKVSRNLQSRSIWVV